MNRVIVLEDNTESILSALQDLVKNEVLVGIPESKTERDDSEPINNATIGYLMEFGAPESNIPARAWLIPGVEADEPQSVAYLREAADAALIGNKEKMREGLNKAGLSAADQVKQRINSNIPPPLAPSTIANRHRQRKTKTPRKSEIEYARLIGTGMAPGAAQDATGIISLINTGAFRNSVTYVVRKA